MPRRIMWNTKCIIELWNFFVFEKIQLNKRRCVENIEKRRGIQRVKSQRSKVHRNQQPVPPFTSPVTRSYNHIFKSE